MTDQDWEVDGATGGSAGGDSGSGATRPDRDEPDSRPANVVPFPGNWFGSVDELIPIHPGPRPSLAEVAAAPAESRPASAAAEPTATAAADASDFWEGDAASLEEVSVPTESQASIALLRSPGAAKRKSVPPARSESVRDSDAGPDSHAAPSPEAGSQAARPADAEGASARRAWTGRLGLLLLAAVVATGLLIADVIPSQLGSDRARHPRDTAAVRANRTSGTVTPTVTLAVTVTTRIRDRTHRHHTPTGKGHESSGSATQASQGGSSRGARASGTTPTTSDTKPATSEPPVVPSHSSVTSVSAGSGCVSQSPDSGCMPG
ncbi:MAG TPA: hypothetical protein VG293_09860 [Solirubrobacteraceae bacterium]|nr:hypothetical protein [Solirubrobacteraceae bacterium]